MDKVKGGYIEGIVSIITNTILSTFKFWVGISTGSLALIADGWHTLSDSISSVILVIAMKLMSKKADKEHPFGHGRWEQIASLFIAFILAIIGYDFIKEAIIRFSNNNREIVHFGTAAIVVMISSIIIKEGLAQYAFYIARKTGNESVRADGWHHRSDSLASLIVVLGMVFAQQFWWIDSAMAAIVALFLFYATFEIVNETVKKMLGEEPKKELIDEINAYAKKTYNDSLYLHHFHIHNYVTHNELTMHIRLDKKLSIEKGHQIASEIEDYIKKTYNMSTTIHVEPLLEKIDI
jgi:cation diffusion facilitator family transporter